MSAACRAPSMSKATTFLWQNIYLYLLAHFLTSILITSSED